MGKSQKGLMGLTRVAQRLARRIPEEKYLTYADCKIITQDMLWCYHTPKQIEAFINWMASQTCMLLPTGNAGYYVSDYERWLHGRPCID